MLSEFLALISGDLSGVSHVALIADENAGDVVGCVLLDLVHPVFDGAEALTVREVIGHDDAVSALVVAARYGLEALLASGIPNLELNSLAINLNSSYFLYKQSLSLMLLYLRSRHQ